MIKERLIKIMDLKGISGAALASMSGVPQSRISDIVTGKTANPQMKTLQKIAVALDVPVGQLTGEIALPVSAEPQISYGHQTAGMPRSGVSARRKLIRELAEQELDAMTDEELEVFVMEQLQKKQQGKG